MHSPFELILSLMLQPDDPTKVKIGLVVTVGVAGSLRWAARHSQGS